jgi:hypothetical protein
MLRFLKPAVFLLLFAAGPLHAQQTVTVAWDRNPESDVVGYILLVGSQSGVYSNSQDVGGATRREITLQPGTYFFALRAYNSMGLISAPSSEASVTIGTTPGPPVTVTWQMVWQHDSTGQMVAWGMSGLNLVKPSSVGPGRVDDPEWRIKATADMNADGKKDLLFQHDSAGFLAVWLMSGDTLLEAKLLSPGQLGDPRWQLVGAADMNDDQKPDLVFQHPVSGHLSAWYMNGTSLVQGVALTPGQVSDSNWRIVAVSDLDGNGRPDLVWHHATAGRITSWLMDGVRMVAPGPFSIDTTDSPDWKPRTMADVNDDGQADLIWLHSTGHLAAWLLNGRHVISTDPLNPSRVTQGWRPIGR